MGKPQEGQGDSEQRLGWGWSRGGDAAELGTGLELSYPNPC